VKQFHFDPFRDRLARDIRNNLSKAFLLALAENNVSIFQRCGAYNLRQSPEPGYVSYVKTRLANYEEVYAIIQKKKLRDILQQATILWDRELYFEMHELLEPEWKEAEGDRRKALQGLIRAAGMKIHAENKNKRAAVTMGAKALTDLVNHSGELKGFEKLEAVLADVKQAIGKAQGNT
jgi:predicted metal-dependent hydrolase